MVQRGLFDSEVGTLASWFIAFLFGLSFWFVLCSFNLLGGSCYDSHEMHSVEIVVALDS